MENGNTIGHCARTPSCGEMDLGLEVNRSKAQMGVIADSAELFAPFPTFAL